MFHAFRHPTAAKVAASIGLLGAAAGIAGLGTFAQFTGSTTASHSIGSGTVSVALGAAGTTGNRLTVGASDLAPGDTVQRVVTLSNTGSIDWSVAALTTEADASSVLDTDTTDGLQMTVERCDVPWTESGSAPAYTYTCDGNQSSVVASRPVIGSNLDLGQLDALAAGGADNLRVTLRLPASADNSFQGAGSTLSFTFTGTQRAATDR